VKGLYLVGVASANSFGPLTRFAYGAKFTAEHITKHLVKVTKTAPQEVRNELTATAQQEAVRP
jgi:hypothetical protein